MAACRVTLRVRFLARSSGGSEGRSGGFPARPSKQRTPEAKRAMARILLRTAVGIFDIGGLRPARSVRPTPSGIRIDKLTKGDVKAASYKPSWLLLLRAWRKLLKQFLHALIQILDVLIGVIGEGVAGGASPEELFRLGVEQIHNQCAYLIRLCRGGCFSEASASKASPAPASSEPVVKGVQGLLVLRDLHGYDRNVTARIHLGPTLCCQGGIDGILDSVNNKWILRLDALPRVGLVLREVCAAIVIGLYLLRRRPAGEQKHHCHQSEHDSLNFHNSSFLLSRDSDETFSRQNQRPLTLREPQFQGALAPLLCSVVCRHVFLSFHGR